MPKDKDFKRVTRARMRKTGESYTAARAQLLRKKTEAPNEGRTAAADLASIGGTSDETLREKTGRTWADWVTLLDSVDAVKWPHREIAAHLIGEHGLPHWWAQTVAVGYERIRGLRVPGQLRDGTHEFTRSRTLPVPLDVLYRAASEAKRRRQWLPGIDATVRKATRQKTVRLTWPDDTRVDLYFTAKGDQKSVIQIHHRRLPSKAAAERMKTYWTERLDALTTLLAARR